MPAARLAAAVLALAVLAAPSEARTRVALFAFELDDTSLEGELGGVRTDETARLALIGAEARRLLDADPELEFVDLAPAAAEIAARAPLYKCNGCEADIARAAGADLAVSGYVQKVSNLILNLNFSVRDARTGERKRLMSVDIRTNSDEMWLRGVRWLVKNRLNDPPLAATPR